MTPAERLYSRLQVKSELTVAKDERDGGRGDVGDDVEDDVEDDRSVESDAQWRSRSDAPSPRLLTPASFSSVYQVGGDDGNDAFYHREQVRGRGKSYDDRGGRGEVEEASHRDVQVQVILNDLPRSDDRGRGNDQGSCSSSSSVIVVNSPVRRGSGHSALDSSQQQQLLLQSRVEALERILALHDSAMENELARVAGAAKLSLPTGSGIGGSRQRTAQLYVKMLSMWREKTVALMVQLQCKELARSEASSRLSERLEELEEARSQLQSRCDVWEQRVKDTEAQRDLHLSRVAETEKRCEAASAKAVAAVRTMAMERERLQHTAELVAAFTAVRRLLQVGRFVRKVCTHKLMRSVALCALPKSDGVVSQKMSELLSGLKRVDALKRRLERMRDRLGTAALLAAHREARLRNTEAAMEAERRMLVHRVQKLQEASASLPAEDHGDRSNKDAASDSKGASNGAASRRLGRHRKLLRPATEAALRALFHRLDVYETGLVRSAALLDALRVDESVKRALGDDDGVTSLVAHVELALERQQQASTLDGMLVVPRGPAGKITWGEFLLLFLPDTPSESIIGNGDQQDGRGLGGDAIGSLALPCGLCASTRLRHGVGVPEYDPEGAADPQDATAKQQGGDQRHQQWSRRELIAELVELRKDRDALRRRVLADAHDLQSRAAKIRNEWTRKTEQLACDNDDLRVRWHLSACYNSELVIGTEPEVVYACSERLRRAERRSHRCESSAKKWSARVLWRSTSWTTFAASRSCASRTLHAKSSRSSGSGRKASNASRRSGERSCRTRRSSTRRCKQSTRSSN